MKTAVAHLVGKYNVEFQQDRLTVSGHLGWAKGKGMSTFNLIVLRVLMYTVGRFKPDLVRRLLQRLLITGRQTAPFTFRREFQWIDGRLEVKDELRAESWGAVRAAGIGPAQTSIYVVMSRTYQAGQLQPWLDLSPRVRELREGEPLQLTRTW